MERGVWDKINEDNPPLVNQVTECSIIGPTQSRRRIKNDGTVVDGDRVASRIRPRGEAGSGSIFCFRLDPEGDGQVAERAFNVQQQRVDQEDDGRHFKEFFNRVKDAIGGSVNHREQRHDGQQRQARGLRLEGDLDRFSDVFRPSILYPSNPAYGGGAFCVSCLSNLSSP